jgi:hypothetical protein
MLQRPSWDAKNFGLRKQSRFALSFVWHTGFISYLILPALSLVIAFLLVAAGLALVQSNEVLLPAALFIGAGLIALPFLARYTQKSRSPDWKPFLEIDRQHDQIKILLRGIDPAQAGPKNISQDEEKIFLDLYRSFLNIANSGATVITSEVSAPCAVSVKLLWLEKDGSISVRKFIRDSSSRQKRLVSPDGFSVADNTAFQSVVFGSNQYEYFASDNLTTLASTDEYRNVNESWMTLYNSTAVAPIRSTEAIIGFICVDSWYGRLSDVRVRRLLELLASHLYTGIQLLLLNANKLEENSESAIGFVKIGGQLEPRNRVSQLCFQRAVEQLHASVQPVVDREDLLTTLQQQAWASHERPGVELGVAGDSYSSSGIMADSDDFFTDSIPDWALDPESEKLSQKIRQLTDDQFAEILRRSAPGNPYAEGLLKSIEKDLSGKSH